jgi:putative transposase
VTNRTIKYGYQKEAELAGFKTLEELNTAFWAWAELEYNKKIHSSTGQAPDERFIKGLPENHRRIKDIEKFNAMFLWKETRKVSKYGKIKLYSNQYPVQTVAHGNKVQVRFDPLNLKEVYIYDLKNNFLENTQPNKMVNMKVPNIPEESKKSPAKVSQDSVNYLTRLREKYLESQKKSDMRFSKLFEEKEDNND